MAEQENLPLTHTLCLLVKEDQVLLAMKKRGFGEGKWNGVGGKINSGESDEEAALRETQEEINVLLKSFQKVGTLIFRFTDKPDWNQQVGVYLVNKWEGEPTESDEMKPQWFNKNNIPLDQMWKADTHWLPKVLTGKKITAHFRYNKDQQLLDFNLFEED